MPLFLGPSILAVRGGCTFRFLGTISVGLSRLARAPFRSSDCESSLLLSYLSFRGQIKLEVTLRLVFFRDSIQFSDEHSLQFTYKIPLVAQV